MAAPFTPKSRTKIKIGSKIIFKTVPSAVTIMGSFISPSPESIDLKNPEKIIQGKL